MSNLYIYGVSNSRRDLQDDPKSDLYLIIQSSCRISLAVGADADSLRGLAQAGKRYRNP